MTIKNILECVQHVKKLNKQLQFINSEAVAHSKTFSSIDRNLVLAEIYLDRAIDQLEWRCEVIRRFKREGVFMGWVFLMAIIIVMILNR